MIEELQITDLGVIEQATIPLAPGMTAITGETGAGKTMVLSGLGLILGRRADAAVVRAGATGARAEGRFLLDPRSAVAARVRDAGGVLDGDIDPDIDHPGAEDLHAPPAPRAGPDRGSGPQEVGLVVVRTVAASRSRAVLGGVGVPVAVLAELADSLVAVHGQADQARLRSPRHQRAALDAFAGPEHARTLAAHRGHWDARQAVAAELAELEEHAADRRREAELLRVGLAEVERVDPQPDEDVALAAEAERLGHLEDLRAAAARAHAALTGGDGPQDTGAATLVDQARRVTDQAGVHDPALAALAGRLAEAGYLLDDVAAELAGYADTLDADPHRLDAVQQRRAELTGLARAHGGTVADVLAWAAQAGPRLVALDGGDDRRAELRTRLGSADAAVQETAARLTAGRTAAAAELAARVSAELAGLAMAGAELSVVLHETGTVGPWGAEDVEMLLRPHAGAPARPLGQGASGGELSRVMLAVEVALATAPDVERPATFVFDEVDAGVGGRAAVEVGRRLAELARQSQVVVVTHLAQVAAFADQHLAVTKTGRSAVVTASDVRVLTEEERVAELARMLSGTVSATALEHARELLATAHVGR